VNDEDASRVLPVLESLLKNLDLDRSFRIWAAQVMGRGFVMCGLTSGGNKKARQTQVAIPVSKEGFPGLGAVSSYTSIVRHLTNLLWTSDYPATSFAENTLQLIFSNMSHSGERGVLEPDFDGTLVRDMSFMNCPCPTTPLSLAPSTSDAKREDFPDPRSQAQHWAGELLAQISDAAASDPVLNFLKPLINAIPESADALLPYSVHLILLGEFDSRQVFRERLSEMFSEILSPGVQPLNPARPLVLKTLLYLRKCQLPQESNMAQRNYWLEVDLHHAAMAASDCQMWHAALLFLELHQSQAQLQTGRSSRRSHIMIEGIPTEVISKIYENVDDPDFFYGKHQTYDLQSVISKLGHEGASQKSLSFSSAMLDSQLRVNEQAAALGPVAQATASTLSAANMQGISEAVRQHYEVFQKSPSVDSRPAEGRWDLLAPNESTPSSMGLLALFRGMHNISNKESFLMELDRSLLDVGVAIKADSAGRSQSHRLYSSLAVLAEARQTLGATSAEGLESACAALAARNKNFKLAE
jgi:ataxia telangiectasia mutated family protein